MAQYKQESTVNAVRAGGFQQEPRAECGTEPLSAMSQSPKSERGLCKSVSILGRPIVVDVHYKCGAATALSSTFGTFPS